ncbi:formylglycine-generating enzyme family protein [Myxococcota bacterium]|nr:formylglycine-generating enzyme family protein [Myxococcota bacterium]MBU1412995.1 formylglycine-generating enzyme family protein [Myxococcota bacterium]MBU1510995.1 formylglycine-generating enzyme family protein [Myxococcota bacterium]
MACTLVFFTGCNTGDGTCGDGILQRSRGETCEPDLLLEATCEALGHYPGTLACGDDCGYSYVGCGGFCGDGRIQTAFGEACDGDDLAGKSCVNLGFNGGILGCNADCTALDTTGCELVAMIEVPAGTFRRDEDPANLSTVSAFLMSRTEITRWQYLIVMGDDPTDETYSGGPGDPVQNLRWRDALRFCNKLSVMEGRQPVYRLDGYTFEAVPADFSADGYRLPTQMEWMWAALGADLDDPGAVNTTGYLKAFAGDDGSNMPGDYAVFGYENPDEEGRTTTHRTNPVCSRLPNELGLCDLSGNVWEWTWDAYFDLPAGSLIDYRLDDLWGGDFTRVVHGGYWGSPATSLAVDHRTRAQEEYPIPRVGFRVVRRR